ncbi:Peptidase family M23 [Pelagirhabdus alkalitolerans]|uniref:Peptidase family M23 n=1 Tax=Pelagirhabdus alkalitolerans TaxID=1612202 RepID=A0A1G6GR85_9BACI|nr:M23 family metallopeptidase [Pelagirhabdus alkalitolerans]SDB83706.1 Peptidase family M23 [Pelagirhabdus alkalitolerans]
MNLNNKLNKYKIKLLLLEFSRNVKYVGITSVILTFFFESIIFTWLSLLSFFAFVEVVLDFSVYKASALQLLGEIVIKIKYRQNTPTFENYQSEVVYSLPFDGEWVIINGSYIKSHSHSWDITPQRYAYDFVIMNENGTTYEGKPNNLSSYFCYDQDILAPADGEVVQVYNKAEDSLLFKSGKFLSRSPHIAGNYIMIKHSENEYSTLAHLKKDSICVNEGDHVSRGEKVATCGNTGNSTEPHLHFQVQNGNSFFTNPGCPIKFENYELKIPKQYKKIDPRLTLSKEEMADGYITRGYIVKNQ